MVTLKASTRNCTLIRSRILKSLVSDISISQEPGPGTFDRPKSPSVPNAGCAKAAGLIQHEGFGLAHNGFAKIWFGRCPPVPLNWRSVEYVGVRNPPLFAR